MARADIDELKIVIEADDKASAQLDALINKLEKLGNVSIGDGFKGFEDKLKKTENQAEMVGKMLDGLKNKAVDIKINTDSVEKAERAVDALATKASKSVSPSVSTSGMREVEGTVNRTATAVDDLGKKAKQSFDEWNKGIEQTAPQLDALDRAVNKAGSSFGRLGIEVGKSASKMLLFPFMQVAKGAGKLTGAIGKLFTKLKTVAMYRALRGFIKMINEGFKEGTQNAYEWSRALGEMSDMGRYASTLDSLASSALYLKNAFGAVAIPILNALEPAITSLIAKVVDAINVLNRLFATLSGATTWTKALYYPKKFADELDNATGRAKALKDAITILGIDEINPLNAVKEPGGGSGSGADALDYSSMFEEVALEAENMFSDIFEPFRKAWDEKGAGVIASIERSLSNVKQLAKSVGDSFYEVWTNGTGQEAIEHILSIFTGISDTIGNIAKQLSIGWEFNDNGTRIVQAFGDMLNDILAMWDDIAFATAEWAGNLDFRPVIDALADLAEGVESVLNPITRAISWTWENVILVLGEWTIERGLPKAVSELGTALGKVGDALSVIGESKVGGALAEILGFFERNALSTLDKSLQKFSDLLKVIGDIADILSGKKTFKMVWFEWMEENSNRLLTVLHYLGEAWDALINVDFARMEDALRNAWNPTNSDYYMDITAQINRIDDKRTARDKRLGFTARLTEVEEDFKMPSGNKLDVGGVTYGFAGGTTKLGKVNFDGTAEIDATANITNTNDKLPTQKRNVNNMTAVLEQKSERFSRITDSMTALLSGKSERFDKTTGEMTASLSKKSETFTKTTSDMTAKLSKKSETFGLTTTDMTAKLSKKSETFSKTTDGMTANLTSRVDNIASKDRWIDRVSAYVKALYKDSGFTGIKLTGSTYTSNGKMTVTLNKNGGIFENGLWHSIPQYAGGTLNAGSMFIAGESGAEIVGHVNGRTEVLNQSQIAQAMASSMMQANAGQNALLQEQNNLLRQLLEKDSTVTAILSTSSLTDGVARKNRRDGRTVIPVGV